VKLVLGILRKTHLLLEVKSLYFGIQNLVLDRHLEEVGLGIRTFFTKINELLVVILNQSAEGRELVVISGHSGVHVDL